MRRLAFRCNVCQLCYMTEARMRRHKREVHGIEETIMPKPKTRIEIDSKIRTIYNCDQKALEIAKEVDNIFAQGHHGVAQRTSKVQVLVRDALIDWVRSALINNNVDEEYFK